MQNRRRVNKNDAMFEEHKKVEEESDQESQGKQ